MIIYDLICESSHEFEGWFRNAEDLQEQQASGLLCCPICDSDQVSKKVTASRLVKKSNSAPKSAQQVAIANTQSPEHFAQMQKMLAKVHQYVDDNYEDVGNKFADEARNIHKGEREEANIRGIASPDQIKELEDEGIPAVALPPKPVNKDKLN